MKNRRITIVAFLLIAALTLSFGYAAVTNVLDIQGSTSVSATAAEEEFNKNVYFTGVVDNTDNVVASITDSATYGYTANINTNNNDKAQFTVTGLKKSGDKYSITFEIQNDSAHDATISVKKATNTNEDAFGFSYYFGSEGTKTTTIAKNGGTAQVTVVISLDVQLTEAASASFVLELNVTAGN